MVNTPEGLSAEQSRDFDALFGSRFGKIFQLSFVAVLFVTIALVIWVATSSQEQISADLLEARTSLAQNEYEWSQQLIAGFDEKHSWLQRHGLGIEISLFEKLGTGLFSSARILRFDRAEVGFLPNAFIGLHFVLNRLIFLVLATWRIWAVFAIFGAVYARRSIRPYQGDDLLGQTGNGRLYYSGVLAHLDDVDERGAPKQLATGLACPRVASPEHVLKSELYALLGEYGADNGTNEYLVGIILQYSKVPGFLTDRDDARNASDEWASLNLSEYAEHWLAASLRLHARLQNQNGGEDAATQAVEPESALEASIDAALSRVLTAKLKRDLKKVPAALIASLVLAHQAGKVLVYAYEGSRWTIRSRFPELAARAILHSVPQFAEDYDTQERNWIRRSLVFASRRSVFAPVRMPTDLSPETKILRNWSEVLLNPPQKLTFAADEIELVTLLDELHERWQKFFFEAVQRQDERITDAGFASRSNLLFLPVANLIEVFGNFTKSSELDRLAALSTFVAQKTRIDVLASPGLEENSAESRYFDKLPGPLGFMEIKELARRHNLNEDLVQRWSSYRMVLHAFGWLARRVGEFTVPESSIIFAVFESEEGSRTQDVNAQGLIGKAAMVPLRISRLASRWGNTWPRAFRQVGAAMMAQTQDDYERMLKGELKDVPPEVMELG